MPYINQHSEDLFPKQRHHQKGKKAIIKQPQRRRHDSVYINVSSALLSYLISGKYILLLNFSSSVKKVMLDCIFSKKKERKIS